jgi:hypothetical protein
MQSDKHLNNVQELSSTQNLVRIETGIQVNQKFISSTVFTYDFVFAI